MGVTKIFARVEGGILEGALTILRATVDTDHPSVKAEDERQAGARLHYAISKAVPRTADAVDPQVASPGKPSTRD
jgi:hypothetical protein